MKHLPKSLGLLVVPVLYTILIPLNQPNYAHALIVLGLLGLIGYICKLELAYRPVETNSELASLQKEYQIENLKTNIEQIKTNRSRQAAMRDEFGSLGGVNKEFKF